MFGMRHEDSFVLWVLRPQALLRQNVVLVSVAAGNVIVQTMMRMLKLLYKRILQSR